MHYDRVSHVSYVFALCALGVHIVYYVLRITYYVLCITHWESTSYVMYYVLCIVYDASYIAHFRQAHHVCVLAATFYVLAAGTCTYYEKPGNI